MTTNTTGRASKAGCFSTNGAFEGPESGRLHRQPSPLPRCGALVVDVNTIPKHTHQFLFTPTKRHSVFLPGSCGITDSFSACAQANYSNIEVATGNAGLSPAATLWSWSSLCEFAALPDDNRSLP